MPPAEGDWKIVILRTPSPFQASPQRPSPTDANLSMCGSATLKRLEAISCKLLYADSVKLERLYGDSVTLERKGSMSKKNGKC